jgi:uncharacterized protein YjlB
MAKIYFLAHIHIAACVMKPRTKSQERRSGPLWTAMLYRYHHYHLHGYSGLYFALRTW